MTSADILNVTKLQAELQQQEEVQHTGWGQVEMTQVTGGAIASGVAGDQATGWAQAAAGAATTRNVTFAQQRNHKQDKKTTLGVGENICK